MVSENFWNNLILVASIIFLQLIPGIQKIEKIPLLDEVYDGDKLFNHHAIHFYISSRSSTHVSTIYDLNLNSTALLESALAYSNISSKNTSEKKELKREKYITGML